MQGPRDPKPSMPARRDNTQTDVETEAPQRDSSTGRQGDDRPRGFNEGRESDPARSGL